MPAKFEFDNPIIKIDDLTFNLSACTISTEGIPFTEEDPDYSNKKYVFRFQEPVIFECKCGFFDLRLLNNLSGGFLGFPKKTRWRQLYKQNPAKYALVIYNKKRKYEKDKMSFEEFRKKKGIVNV